jgi:DNA invertase Pin-like site-specific DNA recombinase
MVQAERTPVAYGYGRHSTNKQELTREVQEFRTHEYWERNLKPKGIAWGGFYYDAATSARIPFGERAQGRSLCAIVQPGDHVVVSKLDRPFRSLRDGIVSMDMFSARNVAFHSLDLLIDTSTPLGRFFRTVLLAVAELEREFVSERVKETIALRKREGKPHGQGCPIGWKILGQKPNRYYRVDMQERALVDAMAQMRKSGMSYDSIALWCMRQAMPNKRVFSTRDIVKWALRARRAGYPKVTNYKEFHRMVKSGEITLSPA